MDARRSDPRPGDGNAEPPGWWQAIGALGALERLAALGAVVCAAATILPWYQAPVGGLVKTGLGSFGFVMAAQLLSVGAALFLLLQGGRGRRPALPLYEGTLLALAGFWAVAMVVYSMVDRPSFPLSGFETEYRLAYGIFVALGAAGLLGVMGLRIRAAELSARRRPRR